jgi:hypothetical protein
MPKTVALIAIVACLAFGMPDRARLTGPFLRLPDPARAAGEVRGWIGQGSCVSNASRVPELRPYLLEVFEAAEPGTEHVITRYRDSACNLRTHFGRIIRKAGLEVWPKPWHNLRATRQTELAERYPIHVVCQWIGNSRAVAQEHYLQVTDAHFAHAVAEPLKKQPGAKGAAQNPAQYPAESSRTERETVGAATQNRSDFPSDSEAYDSVRNSEYPRQDSNL